MKQRLLALLLVAGALVGASAGTSAERPAASASATAVSIAVPTGAGAVAGTSVAPGTPTAAAGSFVYPADGSIVRTGALSSSAAADAPAASAQAVADVSAVSLFNGEITFDSAGGRANASSARADTDGSSVVNLVINGQPVSAAPNQSVPLGDWGVLVTLPQSAELVTGEKTTAHATVAALRVTLSAEHAGLPAGTVITFAQANAASSEQEQDETPQAPAKPTTPSGGASGDAVKSPRKPPTPPKRPAPDPPFRDPGRPTVLPPPTDLYIPLSAKGYVFPVYGDAGFSDSWGAPRASTGRHQGTDIFAPLGAPILAVADGRLFSVGWNRIGGWRLWLIDREGNQFYYAHLSAYSTLARDGAYVRAGQVIGFNGNSGDAEGTPFHVHFEIHPVALLPLGYEGGAVNPFPYLQAWRRVQDVSFTIPAGDWGGYAPVSAKAPRPGAYLLQSSDISSASGLDPGGLERALATPVASDGPPPPIVQQPTSP